MNSANIIRPGRVFWLTGLSGSGKSTIAHQLTEEIRKVTPGVVYLDGDIIREVLPEPSGHTLEERRQLAASYGRLCRMLSDQGVWVVAAVIAMFHEVQRWNRENIEDYVEVFVSVPMEELIRRDQKGLYSRALAGEIDNVVGIDIPAEEPECPEIVIDNHGERSSRHAVETILEQWGPSSTHRFAAKASPML